MARRRVTAGRPHPSVWAAERLGRLPGAVSRARTLQPARAGATTRHRPARTAAVANVRHVEPTRRWIRTTPVLVPAAAPANRYRPPRGAAARATAVGPLDPPPPEASMPAISPAPWTKNRLFGGVPRKA